MLYSPEEKSIKWVLYILYTFYVYTFLSLDFLKPKWNVNHNISVFGYKTMITSICQNLAGVYKFDEHLVNCFSFFTQFLFRYTMDRVKVIQNKNS